MPAYLCVEAWLYLKGRSSDSRISLLSAPSRSASTKQWHFADFVPDYSGGTAPDSNRIAQHATATCCRGCISKWHGIEKGRALNVEEVDFVVALIMGWIERQINQRTREGT
jgi:hypothetical protein